jgi:two-component system nitrogen regulation sensor histidine kinase GlnL
MNTLSILNNISTSLIITNKFMEIVHVNASGENFLQSSFANLKNVKINEIFAKKNNVIISQVYDAIALNQPSVSRDVEVSLKSKIKHNLDCSVHTIFIDKEKHVLLEINLIHRKKNIEKGASLADRNNTTQMITRSIAHEIKNPLGGIKGAAQLLASELGERHADYINIIINEVDRLKNYVDKMSGPKNEPVFELVNIHSIIERVIKISNTAENNKLIFIKNYDPSIPNVNIDKDMIIQSLLNIVKNAIEASASNSRIEIKTRIERNYTINGSIHKLTAVISVIDYGSGVSEDIKNKLFLPLVTNKFNGSGLGLSISQRLVAINDGIIIFNEENDKTIFKIILPIEAY